jgi:DNA topoisomerase-1
MDLIIVESPTKAKTIGKFVGKDFVVESSYGHIRDLPKSKLGIDVKHDFAPTYVIPKKAEPVVENLRKLAKKADRVILATDEDREGEAIAWHLMQALELTEPKKKNRKATATERIAFHEITKDAILRALEHPRALDINLVNAQQARRVLDRLVGYELSPFLWRKVRYGLSAGRVQSVAVRLVVERERLIQAFKKEEYWTIEGKFSTGRPAISDESSEKSHRPSPIADHPTFPATLVSIDDKTVGKMGISTEADAKEIVDAVRDAKFNIKDITVKDVRRNPAAPFTTSTLQQEAARKLGFSAKQTMMIAQHLYENGFITYMRTDSVNLAESALAQARVVIVAEFGAAYALDEPRRYATKSKGAQEAHEAIRPTNLGATSAHSLGIKDRNSIRLYDLVWKRTVASQMKEAILEQTAVDIEGKVEQGSVGGEQPEVSRRRSSVAERYLFRANGQTVKFDGFIRVYTEGRDDDASDEVEGKLPKLETGQSLSLEEVLSVQHFTEPPARYTDATLVKALEADGIGRPSTYAPTLSTIHDRGYVEKIDKKYQPTEIGILVNDLLVAHFPEIVDIKFTSRIEEEFDEIAEGNMEWTDVCREFYVPFKRDLAEKEATVEKQIELSDVPCPEHPGEMMIVKFGRMGKFLACPQPGVKITLPMPEEAAEIKALEEKTKDERCPICGKPMKIRRGRFGYFLGCVDYPACKGVAKIWDKTGFKCPNCKIGDIVLKKSRGRGRPFYACNRWPACTFLMGKKPESEADLEEAFKAWQKNPPKEKRTPTKRAKKTA